MLAAPKWLEDHAHEGSLNIQATLRFISPRKTPIGTPMMTEITPVISGGIIWGQEGRREKGHEHEQNIRSLPRAR
jgi:hypothetical protein